MIVPNNTANVEHRPIVNNRQTNEKPLNTPADSAPINIKHGDPNRSCEGVGRNSIPHNPANRTWSGGSKLKMLGETTAKCPSFTLIEKSSTEHKEAEERRFSKRLAIDIATERGVNTPDVTVALVAQTMVSWQSASYKKIDGKPVGWKSAAGIQAKTGKHKKCKGLPWLAPRTINDAMNRLEEAFPNDITIVRSKTRVRFFSFSEDFIKKYMESEGEQLAFRLDDAIKVGVLQALLIKNLEYSTAKELPGALKDKLGKVYSSISATWLTKPAEPGKLPMLPYSRKEVTAAISKLKAVGVFQKHPTEDAYRVNRDVLDALGTSKSVTKPRSLGVLPNRQVVLPNRHACNQTAQLCNETAQYEPIDIKDIIIDGEEIECVKGETSLCSISPIFPESKNQGVEDKVALAYGLATVECESSARANALAKYINPTDCELKAMDAGCKSIEDFFPGTLDKVNRVVEKYRSMLKTGTLLSVVPPDEQSPFEIIIDPVYAGWLELDVDISPITNKPIDYGDIEEQIDLAIYYLEEPMVEEASKKDLAAFRSLFHHYPALLDIKTLKGVFEHLCILEDEPPKKVKNKYVHDHEYFARRIQTLEQFVRYFPQLFAEAYVGYADKPEFYNGKPQRNWDRLLDDNGGTIPEPYWSILAPYYKEDQANRATGLEGYEHLAVPSNDDQDKMCIQRDTVTYQVWQDHQGNEGIVPDVENMWTEQGMQSYADNGLNDSLLLCGVNR